MNRKLITKLSMRKVFSLIAVLMLFGQTVLPTITVLAETTANTHEVITSSSVEEQAESATEIEENATSSQDFTDNSLPEILSEQESNQSNAPPIDQTDMSVEADGTLSVDAEGNLYYDGELLYYPDGKVPANMEELFKRGVPMDLKTRASVGTAAIQYVGTITWGYHTVGDFRVNGKQAFCIQHPVGTPATGTPNNGLEPHSNSKMQAILYWGWEGPKNIFTDRNAGIVATSLALSYYYYGDGPYNSLPSGYDTLIAKAEAGDVPKHGIKLNEVNTLVKLPVTFDGIIQKSGTATLKADSSNSITFTVPSNMTFKNETTGESASNKIVKVYGGQKYHFEASANVSTTFSSNSLKGTVKEFQPLVIKPISGGLQTLGTWRMYDDPAQVVSFSVEFSAREGHLDIEKLDDVTGEPLANAKFSYEYGTTKSEGTSNSKGTLSLKNIPDGSKVTVTEIVAPNGYVINTTPQTVTIEAGKTAKLVFTNKKISGSVKLIKYADEEIGTGNKSVLLEGAEFSLIDTANANTVIGKGVTNAKGEYTFKDITYGTSYIIRETKAPVGFEPIADIPVNITENGKVYEIKATDKIKHTTLKIAKADKETGELVAGATISYEYQGKIAQGVTGIDGTFTTSSLPHGAEITVIEVKSPTGYVLNSTSQKIVVDSAKLNTITVNNLKIRGSIKLVKKADLNWTNGKTNDYLKGAEFTLFNPAGKVVDKAVTNDRGEVIFSNHVYGLKYTVKETVVPVGYLPVADMTVDITENGKTYELFATDKVIREDVEITKVGLDSDQSILSKDTNFKIKNLQTSTFVSEKDILTGKETDVYTTDKDGHIKLSQLPNGDYELSEIKAPNGYLILTQPIKFTVDGSHNGLIKIKVGNKLAKGQVTLTKTGQKVVSVETSETDYGTVYTPTYDYVPLEGATFDIFATKDILTGDGVLRHKLGELIGTYTTGENGAFQSPEYFVGSYEAIEKSAPNGYIIDSAPIKFDINYEGETVPLTSTAVNAANEWNVFNLNVNKLDESLVGWENNEIKLETVPSIDKVFGIFKTEDFLLNSDVLIPANGLVAIITTENGVANVKGQFPDGEYYAKELNAGKDHVLSDKTYPVSLVPTDNREIVEANIFEDVSLVGNENLNRMTRNPIVNRLYRTDVPFEKINETTKLMEKQGYTYEYNQQGEGAEFRLMNSDQQVIQTLTLDETGIGSWTDLIVGTYYMNESKTSVDNLVLDTSVYRIEVTQENVQIFNNETNELLGEKLNEETEVQEVDVTEVDPLETSENGLESPVETLENIKKTVIPLFIMKNRLKRGTAILEKTDVSTGKKLPETGIKIKDKDGKTVVEGRTDKDGTFTFEKLPKGTYTFLEFDAPKGYLIDETPIPFEIKEDGDIIKCQMTNVKKVDKLAQTKANKNTMNLAVSLMTVGIFIFALAYLPILGKENNEEL